MSTLQKAKRERYERNRRLLHDHLGDVVYFCDGVSKTDVVRAIASSAEVSPSMVWKVLKGRRTSERVLRFLSAGLDHFRTRFDLPDWI
jgi:hypothetical protein